MAQIGLNPLSNGPFDIAGEKPIVELAAAAIVAASEAAPCRRFEDKTGPLLDMKICNGTYNAGFVRPGFKVSMPSSILDDPHIEYFEEETFKY